MLQKITVNHQLPPISLQNYINKYWDAQNFTKEHIKVPIVPDGHIDIISKNGELFLSGLMQETQVITINPNDNYFGIQFKPYAIALLLGEDVSLFNDKLIPLDSIDGNLAKNLKEIIDKNQKPYEDLNSYFEKFFLDKKIERSILEATKIIKFSYGNITVRDLCKKLGIHQKKLERLFVSCVGITPKKFCKIVRFYNTHTTLSKDGIENLAQKVLEKGYFDQAHFNKDFKKLTGVTPSSKLMSILYNT